ncbi:hypothetical protein FACS1894217_11870 [Clostridia bacterium]|nr:hypothetical protein FACS1894217_11870 [Clostridia bacterium]
MTKQDQLLVFSYGDYMTRTVQIEGETWWVLKDVCAVLGIKNNRDVAENLDEDEKGVAITDTLGGKQELNIINESGLYSLILRSRKPEAKEFKRWITHEVLPSIRKTGGYGNSEVGELVDSVRQLVNVLAPKPKTGKTPRTYSPPRTKNLLHAKRWEKNMSCAQVGNKMGLKAKYHQVEYWEDGERAPSWYELDELARVLDCDPRELYNSLRDYALALYPGRGNEWPELGR